MPIDDTWEPIATAPLGLSVLINHEDYPLAIRAMKIIRDNVEVWETRRGDSDKLPDWIAPTHWKMVPGRTMSYGDNW